MSKPVRDILIPVAIALIFTFGYVCGRRDERKQLQIKREYKVEFRETAHGNYYIDLIPVKDNEK